MRSFRVSPLRILVLAMTVVATCFASAIIYFESSTKNVGRETSSMLSSGMPSAQQLSSARASLRTLDGEIDHALADLAERRTVDFTPVWNARSELDHAIESYRRLPSRQFEADLNQDLDVELRRLDDVLARLAILMHGHQLRRARELDDAEWRDQGDRVDDQLRTLLAFNVRHMTSNALRINHIRKRAAIVGMTVGSFGILLAFAATLVAARAVRRRVAIQEERAAELELFAARVAHDLMSPLAAVSLGLELAREQSNDERVAATSRKLLAKLKRVRNIVDCLYEFARAGSKPEPDERAAVHELVPDVCDELRLAAERTSIELVLRPFAPCEVACAPGVLAIVLSNLVNNAIKFMGDRPIRQITVEIEPASLCVRFAVRDTGPGLPPNFELIAFRPYQRASRNAGGLGLGLATVKRLVEAHQGRVGAQRCNGSGALFWFELPSAAPRGAPDPRPALAPVATPRAA
jgi:signal transduction histidine kinase